MGGIRSSSYLFLDWILTVKATNIKPLKNNLSIQTTCMYINPYPFSFSLGLSWMHSSLQSLSFLVVKEECTSIKDLPQCKLDDLHQLLISSEATNDEVNTWIKVCPSSITSTSVLFIISISVLPYLFFLLSSHPRPLAE